MKRINFALVSDSLFCGICTFLVSFALIGYFVKPAIALATAVISAVAAILASFALMYAKRGKALLLYSDAAEKKTLALHLSVSGEKYITELFSKAFPRSRAVGNRLEDDDNAYFFFFTMSPLSPDDVAKCVKCRTDKAKTILCCAAGEESAALAGDFNITIRQIGEIYSLLKDGGLLPEKYACGNVRKVSAFKKISKRFNRRLCPSLFLCGLSLLFFSLFTYYRIYYIVCGGLLIALAAVSVMFGRAKS